MLVWIGAATICVVVYLLIKQYETRCVLLGAGFFLTLITMEPMLALVAFQKKMVLAGIIETILSVMGFAYVMRYTKCDVHLINLLAAPLRRMRPLLIPGAVMATFLVNTSLVTAAGCAAAVAPILVPLLISQGVHPTIAASAVLAGTFGSLLSPGLMHNPFVAKIANVGVMDVIAVHFWATIFCMIIGAVGLTIVARLLKENQGYVDTQNQFVLSEKIKINPIFALIPLVPIALLMLGSSEASRNLPALAELRVSHCMVIGALLGLIATRSNPQTATKEFFRGTGDGYCTVMGIQISAAVFVAGLTAVGLVDSFIEFLKHSNSVAKIAAGWGPYLLSVLIGTGDAATQAFNESVTPSANLFGMQIINMGSLATLSGALGRTMSPITGACIIVAAMAKVNPLEVAKRNIPGMIIANCVAIWLLAYV